MTFPSAWITGKRGIKVPYYLGSLLLALGASLRMLINLGDGPDYSVFVLIISAVVIGIARPIILNLQSTLLRNWFSLEEQSKFVSVLNFFITVGLIAGSILPGFLFKGLSL